MQRQYGRHRYQGRTPINNPLRVKLGVVLLLSLVLMIVLIFQINYYEHVYPREDPIKVIQLDTLADISDEAQGRWNVSKWKYFKKLEPVVSAYRFSAEDIMHQRAVDTDVSKGFWILGTSTNGTRDNHLENYIRLTNFQYKDPLDLSVGLTLYLEGNVGVEIRLKSKANEWEEANEAVIPIQPEGRYFNYGLCSDVFNILLNDVYEVEIKANLADDKAFAAIDKIVVAVGALKKSRSLMYTMLPNDWCLTIGKRSRTVGKRQGYKL